MHLICISVHFDAYPHADFSITVRCYIQVFELLFKDLHSGMHINTYFNNPRVTMRTFRESVALRSNWNLHKHKPQSNIEYDTCHMVGSKEGDKHGPQGIVESNS